MKQALKSLVKRVGVERRHVEAARMFAERHALASAPRRRARPQGRILCYHSVGQPEFGVNDVTPQRFRAQIEMALGLGYRFVAPAEIAKTGGERMDLAVSFDDALKSVLTEADPILAEYKIPYTVFAVAEWSDQEHDWQKEKVLSWEELGDMRARGVEVRPEIEADRFVAATSRASALLRIAIEKHLVALCAISPIGLIARLARSPICQHQQCWRCRRGNKQSLALAKKPAARPAIEHMVDHSAPPCPRVSLSALQAPGL